MSGRYLLLLVIMVITAGFAAGCTGNSPVLPPGTGPHPSGDTTPVISPATTSPKIAGPVSNTRDLIGFVSRAADFARKNGRETAIATFNDPNGPYVNGSLYIFSEDYNGTALAEPLQQEIVGTDIRNMTDYFGIPLVKDLQETARYGRGYVSYAYPNPKRNYTVEPKLSVVEDVDGTYYVGAGVYASGADIYPSVTFNTSAPQPGVNDLVMFTKKATGYARQYGRENATAAFNDPKGAFVQGQLVIMAFDYNGTNIAGPPYSPELSKYHINLANYQDPDGVETIRGMRDLAREGGGFFYTVTRVNVNGTDIYVPKIDYAEPVDDQWWLFSGIVDPAYTRAVQGNLTGIMVRNHTRAELYALANEAVAYAQAHGMEDTLSEINDPEGTFVHGDLFVWAETTNGTILADPFWKEGIGTNQMEYTDSYGMKTTRVGIQEMQNGTGFYHAIFPDTTENGSFGVPKLIYMKPVDKDWWIGSGIYGIAVG